MIACQKSSSRGPRHAHASGNRPLSRAGDTFEVRTDSTPHTREVISVAGPSCRLTADQTTGFDWLAAKTSIPLWRDASFVVSGTQIRRQPKLTNSAPRFRGVAEGPEIELVGICKPVRRPTHVQAGPCSKDNRHRMHRARSSQTAFALTALRSFPPDILTRPKRPA